MADEKETKMGELITLNPWDYEPTLDWETCTRIKEIARYCRKSVAKTAVFGARDLTEEEQTEFNKYYEEGSAQGEMAISLKLFTNAMAGDSKSVKEYLESKAGWGGDGMDDDDESGLNIYLSSPETESKT